MSTPTPTADPTPGSTAHELTHGRRENRLFETLCAVSTWSTFAVLVILIVSVSYRAWGWLDWQFLTSFDSRKPERAGILAGLLGSCWDDRDYDHVFGAGRRWRSRLPRRIRDRQPAHAHHPDEPGKPRRRPLDRLRHSGPDGLRANVRPVWRAGPVPHRRHPPVGRCRSSRSPSGGR